MAVLRVDDFGGIAPGIDPRNLPDGMAVLAQDCDLHGKSLKPSPDVGPNIGSNSVPGVVDGSLSGATDLLVLPGPVANGVEKPYVKPVTATGRSFAQAPGAIATGDTRWEFYCTGDEAGDGTPLRGVYYGDTTNGAVATPSNATDYAVSLPAAPEWYESSATGKGVKSRTPSTGDQAPPANTPPISVAVVTTRLMQVGSFVFESAPSTAVRVSATATYTGGAGGVFHVVCVYIRGRHTVSPRTVRVYLSTGGGYTAGRIDGTPSVYTGSDGVEYTCLVVSVNERDIAPHLGFDYGPLPSMGWAAAPAGLSSLSDTPFGSLMGCEGNTVHFSDPYHPHAWPPAYDVTLPSDVLDTVNAGGMLVAVTGENAYVMQGGHPDNLAVQASLSEKGGMARGLARTYMGEVFYLCPEGLAVVGQGGAARVLTQDIMDPLTWRKLAWTDPGLRAVLVDGAYYLFNSKAATGWSGAAGTDNTGVKFDLLTGKASLMDSGPRVMGYDARSDRAYANIDGQVKNWRGSKTATKTAKWRSKEWFLERPVNMACARVEYADDATDAQKDGTVLKVIKETPGGSFDCRGTPREGERDVRIPRDGSSFWLRTGRSRLYQMEIETRAEIVSVALATSRRELDA